MSLTYQYDRTGLDGSYVDSTGTSVVVDAPELWLRDPKAFVEELQRTDMAAYSAWSCAFSLGMWPPRHPHRPVSCAGQPHRPAGLPECCEWPMQLVRDGWRCRQSMALFAFVEQDESAA